MVAADAAPAKEIDEPSDFHGTSSARSVPARRHEADGCVQGYGGHCRSGAGGRSLDPERRIRRQEDHRERQDDDEPGHNEADATDEGTHPAPATAKHRGWPVGSRPDPGSRLVAEMPSSNSWALSHPRWSTQSLRRRAMWVVVLRSR